MITIHTVHILLHWGPHGRAAAWPYPLYHRQRPLTMEAAVQTPQEVYCSTPGRAYRWRTAAPTMWPRYLSTCLLRWMRPLYLALSVVHGPITLVQYPYSQLHLSYIHTFRITFRTGCASGKPPLWLLNLLIVVLNLLTIPLLPQSLQHSFHTIQITHASPPGAPIHHNGPLERRRIRPRQFDDIAQVVRTLCDGRRGGVSSEEGH